MVHIFAALTTLALLVFPQAAHAKIFRSAYVQFDLPDRWDCKLEGTEWVCSSQNKNDARESIIILTAKEVGPQDSLEAYERYLKTPKTVNSDQGKPTLSQVKDVRIRKINDHPWVDSMHFGSEIPGYYTRYLATVKDKLAVLITLSAHQKFFTKYSNDFIRAIESLRLIASKDLLNPKTLPPIAVNPAAGSGSLMNTNIPDEASDMPPGDEGESSSGSQRQNMIIGAAVVLLAVGWYLLKKK